jgi:hypothetical protein
MPTELSVSRIALLCQWDTGCRDVSGDTLEAIMKTLQEYWVAGVEPSTRQRASVSGLDATGLCDEAVQAWLKHLPVSKDARVLIVWPADRSGAEVLYQVFVEHLDVLWYPGRDDLWLTDSSLEWMLEVNHEEILTFTTFR